MAEVVLKLLIESFVFVQTWIRFNYTSNTLMHF